MTRVRCCFCNTTHSVIPIDVVPYKQFSLSFFMALLAMHHDDKTTVADAMRSLCINTTTYYRLLGCASAVLNAVYGDACAIGTALADAACHVGAFVAVCLDRFKAKPFENLRPGPLHIGNFPYTAGFT